MLISLRNASVFLRLRSNHLWNSVSCWSDSIQSNKTQASSTSPCGHSNTSFCASHTRLSHRRPCWLHSQSNIMAVFFFPSIILYETDETILFNSAASTEFLDIKRLVNIYCSTPQWLCYVLCVTFGMVQINKHGRRRREWLIMPGLLLVLCRNELRAPPGCCRSPRYLVFFRGVVWFIPLYIDPHVIENIMTIILHHLV